MTYSDYAKNYGKDLIYYTRLRLFDKLGIDYLKNPKLYSYYMTAYLNIILS